MEETAFRIRFDAAEISDAGSASKAPVTVSELSLLLAAVHSASNRALAPKTPARESATLQLEIRHIGQGSVILDVVTKWAVENPLSAAFAVNIASTLSYEMAKALVSAVSRMAKGDVDKRFDLSIERVEPQLERPSVAVSATRRRRHKKRRRVG
jgi:hypothetical protein